MQTADIPTSTPSMSPDFDAAMNEAEKLYTICAQAEGRIKAEGERPLAPTSTDWEIKLEGLRNAMQNNIGSGAKNISLAQMKRLLELLEKMIDVVPKRFLQSSDSIDLILFMCEKITQSGRHTEVTSCVTVLQSRRGQRLALGRGI